MSKVSSEAKMHMGWKRLRLGHKCRASKPIDRSYTNFAGSNVPLLTKESWDKAMSLSHKYRNMSAW